MNAHEEIEHSRVVNELIELKEKIDQMFHIDHEVIKWNYNKAKKSEDEASIVVWRNLLIASCNDHSFEDMFEDDGTYLGFICKHCTANSDNDDAENVKLIVERNCETCIFRGGGSDSISCNHPTIDTLEEVQIDEWMNKYFNDSKNCVHWKGKN